MGTGNARWLIRWVLRGNAVFSGGCGLVAVMGSARLGSVVAAIHPGWYVALGLGLLFYAGAMVLVSRNLGESSWPLWTIVGLDVGWVVGSLILLVSTEMVGSLLGRQLLAVVALIVGLFGILQVYGLGRWEEKGVRGSQHG